MFVPSRQHDASLDEGLNDERQARTDAIMPGGQRR